MKIDYLPTEDDKEFSMYAYYDEQKNEVQWTGVSSNARYMDGVLGTEYAQFLVWRRGNIVIVEGCGWYSSDFHFRVEITEQPDRVVILAHEMAGLMDRAHDEDSPARG